jgi:hypothetical protein
MSWRTTRPPYGLWCRPYGDREQSVQIDLTFRLYLIGAAPNGPYEEVRELTENNYRKWMVAIGLAMLAATIIRLLIGL